MTIPRINRRNGVSIGRRSRLARTIEDRAEENSDEIDLLLKALIVWDLWSIGTIGPGFELRVRHGPDTHGEVFCGARIRGGDGGFPDEEHSLMGKGGLRVIKA